MNRLLLLLLCLTCGLKGISQSDQYKHKVHYVLEQASAHATGLIIYGRQNSSTLVNTAVLNHKSQKLYWFTCHGRAFDSAQLTSQEYQQLVNHKCDPFQLYEQICVTFTAALEQQKDIIRRQIRRAVHQASTQQPDISSLTVSPEILKQLNEINAIQKANRVSLAYFQCRNPHSLFDKPAYHIYKKQTGAVITLRDTVSFFNRDPLAYAYKIEINPAFPDKLLVSNRKQDVIDSLSLPPAGILQIRQHKTDVFALYYRWLRTQWEQTANQALGYRYRYDSMLLPRWSYIRYRESKPELSVLDSLYQQMAFWEEKLAKATAPDAQTVEQAVYEAYTGEPYEMAYMPGGIWGYGYSVMRGNKVYELTNHLGNVLATVSDRKIAIDENLDGTIDYYVADVVSAQDYYPFGMLQPGRSYNAGGYRYGFNGKENDNEVKGEGNQQDYGMRIYDSRVGRFLSVDPLTKQYPHYTPYSFAGNKPTAFIDRDGEEESLEINMRRWETAYLSNKMSEKEYRENVKAMGTNGAVASFVTLDAYFTGGRVSTFLLMSQVFGHLYHNKSPYPGEENKRKNELATDVIEVGAMWGAGKVASDLKSIISPKTSIPITPLIDEPLPPRGQITGEPGVVWAKARAAAAGDLSAEAELRVAKALRNSGSNVHFTDADVGNALKTGTFDFTVDGVKTDVKRIAGIGGNAAGDVAKGVRQVGAGGNVIVVRPDDSKFTYEQYVDFFVTEFKPKQPVSIRVVNEGSLPTVGPPKTK